MRRVRLRNGVRVLLDSRKTESVVIEVQVNVGSNAEDPRVAGICHVLEHMLFEGTKSKSALELASEVERVGGDFNAVTSNERTYFYVHVPKKHFKRGVEVLSDMFLNSVLDAKSLGKEREVILSEIRMVNDNPEYYQWILFLKSVFEKNKARNPVYGTVESVSKISRSDIVSFLKRFYVAENLIVSVAGSIPKNAVSILEGSFGRLPRGKAPVVKNPFEGPVRVEKYVKESRDVEHAYYVMGFRTPSRTHEDSYALDVLATLLGKGQSSRLFHEIRVKRGLVYHIGCQHEANKAFGYFAVFLNAKQESVKRVKELINEQLLLPGLRDEEVEHAKAHLEGSVLLAHESNKERADVNAFWELMGEHPDSFVKRLRKVSAADVKRVAKKYFSQKKTEVVLERA